MFTKTYHIQINEQQKNFLVEGLILLIDQYKHLPQDKKDELITLTQMMATQLEKSPQLNGLCL